MSLCTQDYVPFGAGGRFAWAKFLAVDYVTSWQGVIDEVFLASSVLSESEISGIASRPPQGALASSLVMYWSFDNVSTVAPFYIGSDYGGVIRGRLLKSAFSLAEGLSSAPASPMCIASDAPLLGSGVLVAKQSDAQGTTISSLVGPNAGAATVTSLPTAGQLYTLQVNGQPNAAPLQQSDLPAAAPSGVRFVGVFATNFTYAVGADTATVLLRPNALPQPGAVVRAYVDQQTDAVLAVGSIYQAPPSRRRELKYPLDVDGDAVVCRVTGLPAIGTLSSAGVPITLNQLPFIMPDCKITYSPPDELTGENITSFNVSVSDSFGSVPSVFSITVVNKYYPPRARGLQRSVSENVNVTVAFPEATANIATFQAPQGGPFVQDRPWVEVVSWPALGRIFQTTGASAAGTEILSSAPAINAKTVWVSRAINASSRYSDPSGWSEKEIEGLPNVFPVYGDNPRAWAGAFPGVDEWVEVEFPEALYPSRIDVYMSWYSNLISRISGWDGSVWHVLWAADPLQTFTFLDSSAVFSPPICPTTFPVSRLLIEIAAGGPIAYPEIDAISMTGSVLSPQLSVLNIASPRLTYVPDPYKNGNDSVVYSLNRCINFARYRGANAAYGFFNVSIASVNQAPLLLLQNLVFDMSRNETAVPFSFKLGAFDVDGTKLTATIVRLPSVGRLQNATTGEALDTMRSFDAADTLVYRPLSCLQSPDLTYNVSIRVRISDGSLSTEGDVSILVDCVSNVRRVSRGVEIFVFVISGVACLVCLVFIGLVVVYRNRRSIQKISPLFCAITLIGALSINISPIFLTWSASSCYAWFCFFTLGLTLFLGAIAAKTCTSRASQLSVPQRF